MLRILVPGILVHISTQNGSAGLKRVGPNHFVGFPRREQGVLQLQNSTWYVRVAYYVLLKMGCPLGRAPEQAMWMANENTPKETSARLQLGTIAPLAIERYFAFTTYVLIGL